MRPRTLAILAALVAVLGAIIYFWEGRQPSSDERAALAKKIVPVEAKELLALDLEWSGKRVRLERAPAAAAPPASAASAVSAAGPGESAPAKIVAPPGWRLVEPFPGPADDGAVESLADALTRLESLRSVNGAGRAEGGLAPPRGKVEWRSASRSGSFEIGGALPASHDLLVAIAGATGFAVVPDSFLAQLQKPPGDWRSRDVVTADRREIARIDLAPAGGERVELVRSGELFRLDKPVADAVDRDLADQLLGDLTGLRIATFLDPPLAPEVEASFAPAAGTIEIALEGKPATEALRIEVGTEVAGKRPMRVGDKTFEASTGLAAALARPALEWRSHHWTRFENWRIERVELEDGVGKLELARKDGDWLRDGQRIPFTAASDLLYAVTSAKAERLIEDGAQASPATAGKPTLTLRLVDGDGTEETLTLHPATAAGVPARTSGRALTLLLPASSAADITSKLGALRAAKPLDDPAARTKAPAPANATPSERE